MSFTWQFEHPVFNFPTHLDTLLLSFDWLTGYHVWRPNVFGWCQANFCPANLCSEVTFWSTLQLKDFWLELEPHGSWKLTLVHFSSRSSLSATNSMYCFISLAFIPMREHGRASVRNSCSILTASAMIDLIRSSEGLWTRWLNIRQAKSQWRPCEVLTMILLLIMEFLYQDENSVLVMDQTLGDFI